MPPAFGLTTRTPTLLDGGLSAERTVRCGYFQLNIHWVPNAPKIILDDMSDGMTTTMLAADVAIARWRKFLSGRIRTKEQRDGFKGRHAPSGQRTACMDLSLEVVSATSLDSRSTSALCAGRQIKCGLR